MNFGTRNFGIGNDPGVASGEVVRSLGERTQTLLAYRIGAGEFSVSVSGLVAAVVVLVLVWLLSRLMQRAFTRYASRREEALRPAIYTVSRLTKYLLIVVGALIALAVLGIPLGQFTLLAGAIGVGLGFGLQAIFSNFISGLILLFDRSLKVGDFVDLESGVRGEVREINMRATHLLSNDNIDILVPNSEFVTGRVVNWTLGDGMIRLHVPFRVDFGADKNLVKHAALEAADTVPFTLKSDDRRKPQVWLVEFAESSLNFELVVWLTIEATKRPGAVKAAYNWELDNVLRRHGIGMPFPTADLHIRSLFGLEGPDALRAMHGQPPANESDSVTTTAKRAPPDVSCDQTGNDALKEVQRRIAEDRNNNTTSGATPPDHSRD